MQNPLSSSFRHLIYYLSMWTVIAIVHILFLIRHYNFDPIIACTDAFLFHFTFAALSLGLWYVVKYSLWDEKDALQVIFNLFAAALILIFAWLSLNELLLRLIFSTNEKYIEFLKGFRFWRIAFGFFFYLLIVMVYYLIMYYEQLQIKKNTELELKKSVSDAQLNLLRNQVNPHFLFNSLNSISSLTLNEGEKARNMIGRLSDFLRYSLSHEPNELISLNEEINNCKKYLDIEMIRFEGKMEYHFDPDEKTLQAKIPNLILQPLFENAVKHGVQENVGMTKIECRTKKVIDRLEIRISNNIESPGNTNSIGTQLGQNNISRRLSLLYQNAASCQFGEEGNFYHSKIVIPFND